MSASKIKSKIAKKSAKKAPAKVAKPASKAPKAKAASRAPAKPASQAKVKSATKAAKSTTSALVATKTAPKGSKKSSLSANKENANRRLIPLTADLDVDIALPVRAPVEAPVIEKVRGPIKRRPALTGKQLRELENILLSDRRQHLRTTANLEESLASERESSDGSGDMADASGDVASMESATLLASHSSRALMEIDSALRRLHQSPEYFGVCEVSGEAIPYERLEVVPAARTTAKNSRY